MVSRNWFLALIAGVVLLASPQFGFAETTTIEVPQGTGVFPTIGQVKCLEELGSGRFCAATYECSEDSGELWGDLANHNGRRAIGATSPVANQRDCVITVDGKASARWLTGYRPAGREGELVGLTTSADALRPVVRTTGTTGTGDGGRRLLHYILERHDTSVAEIADRVCDHYRRETSQYTSCIDSAIGGVISAASVPDDELTRCLVGHYESWCRSLDDHNAHICDDAVTMAGFLSRPRVTVSATSWGYGYGPHQALRYDPHASTSAFTASHNDLRDSYRRFNEESGFPCRDVAEKHLAKVGIEVHYCDECDNPNEYHLAPSE